MTYLPALAVSGSLTVACPQLAVHSAGIVEFLKTLKLFGAWAVVRLVCGPRSFPTLAPVVCGPMGALGSAASSFMSRCRAALCAAVGTNGVLLVATCTKRPAATCPVFATAKCVPAGAALSAWPGVAPRSPPSNMDAVTAAASTYHRRTAQFRRIDMQLPPLLAWPAGHHRQVTLVLGPSPLPSRRTRLSGFETTAGASERHNGRLHTPGCLTEGMKGSSIGGTGGIL